MGFCQNPKLVSALAEIIMCSYTLNNKAIVEPAQLSLYYLEYMSTLLFLLRHLLA